MISAAHLFGRRSFRISKRSKKWNLNSSIHMKGIFQLLLFDSKKLFSSLSDSFVNSQEWTLSRSVQDLRVGIVGHVASRKSALVHHYLTGIYVEDESAEGGRFKKEVTIDGSNYLLLIRDEGGSPEIQVCSLHSFPSRSYFSFQI